MGRRSCSPAARPTRPGCSGGERATRASRRGAFTRRRRRHHQGRRPHDRRRRRPRPRRSQLLRPGPEGHASRSTATARSATLELKLGERPLEPAAQLRRMRGIAADLAHALREIVRAAARRARRARARAARRGGDVTFAIDAEAEAFLEGWVAAERARRGLLLRGPRPGRAGRRAGVRARRRPDRRHAAGAGGARGGVRVGRARAAGRRRADDGRRRRVGAVVEIKSGDVVRRRCAARAAEADAPIALEREHGPRPAVLGLRLRAAGPARAVDRGARRADRPLVGRRRHVRPRLGDLRHDAHPHRPARRLRRARAAAWSAEVPGHARGVRARRRRRTSLNNSPYDLAAAALCLEEGGAVVTDAPGGPLGDRPAARLRAGVPDVLRGGRFVRAPSRCLSRPWNAAWSGCVRWISWPRLNPDQEGSPKCFSPSRWPTRAWPTTPTSSAGRSSRRSASSPSR